MSNIQGDSADASLAGVEGDNTANGPGVWGSANPNGRGVVGVSDEGAGVWGHTTTGRGVVGVSDNGVGVWGANRTGRAVVGAVDEDGTGVWGEVKTGTGVVGAVHEGSGAGVSGRNDTGDGVVGTGWRGVVGISQRFQGVYGHSVENAGVVGESDNMHAIYGVSHATGFAGVYGTNKAGGKAAVFDGDVVVNGDIRLSGADCAEHFDAVDRVMALPGTVMVLDDTGGLRVCDSDYDRRVAGVVSGAGAFRPAVILDSGTGGDGARRVPVALVGKVYCKVDGTRAPVAVGDLLTTSQTPGHAMKAEDPGRAFGAVLGKALATCHDCRLIPILVTLQ